MNSLVIFIKLVGGTLIIIGSILYGLLIGARLDKRYEEYEGLRLVLTNLFRNQSYAKDTFPDLFGRIAQIIREGKMWNSYVANETEQLGRILPQTPFLQGWNNYVESISVYLKLGEGIRQQLIRLGISLQGFDGAAMELQILATQDILQEEIEAQRKQLKEKKKISMCCSLMVGVFTVIILI